MTDSDRFSWTVLLPVKVLARAKSRLAVLAGDRRRELALALASDTVSAVVACPEVARVIVVTSDPVAGQRLAALGAHIIDETAGNPPELSRGLSADSADGSQHALNAALLRGAAVAARRWPGTGLAALTADLPALRPAELSAALHAAGHGVAGASFVPDAAGVGTTLYAVPPGVEFRPMYGGTSRARHTAAAAAELSLANIAGLRQDVDTPDDLRAAVMLGVGPRTAGVAAQLLADA
ncbi:MAG: 2-phospho-L-lactate guanylyltransferase [Trebonia sp.]|jgi:2-phospho-L-lactate guanylyltransferase